MIYYDSHKWRTLAKIRGSVLPKAMLWAVPSGLLACSLKLLEAEGYMSLEMLNVLTQGDIYSGFTFVLGFSLVFRTSQSYLRYWTAATSVHQMGSEWSDACASLIAFSTTSKSSQRETMRFRHTVVRLFSMLHAMALEEIASAADVNFPLIDVDGFSKEDIYVLTTGLAQGRKVQVVLQWIKTYITQSSDTGIISVPPPILTRVFQELGVGLVNYHKAQQVVIWPFPFPYTQLNLLLIQVYMVMTPLVISTWRTHAWMCCLFTFISVTCMVGLDLIASELENPFGDDPNDLPVLDMQCDMNKVLIMQLDPACCCPPELTSGAIQDYRQLVMQCEAPGVRKSLKERLSRTGSQMSFKGTLSSSDRLQAQLRWSGQVGADSEILRLQRWLKCLPSQTQRALQEAVGRERLQQTMERDLFLPERKALQSEGLQEALGSQQQRERCPVEEKASGPAQEEPAAPVAAHSLSLGASASACSSLSHSGGGSGNGCCRGGVARQGSNAGCVAAPLPSEGCAAATSASEQAPWSEFLSAFRSEMQEHLEQQLELQMRQLTLLEGLVGRSSAAPPPPPLLLPKRQWMTSPRSWGGSCSSVPEEVPQQQEGGSWAESSEEPGGLQIAPTAPRRQGDAEERRVVL